MRHTLYLAEPAAHVEGAVNSIKVTRKRRSGGSEASQLVCGRFRHRVLEAVRNCGQDDPYCNAGQTFLKSSDACAVAAVSPGHPEVPLACSVTIAQVQVLGNDSLIFSPDFASGR